MFKGIIEATGRILEVEEHSTTKRFVIEAPDIAGSLARGDSVAVDGACLTAVAVGRSHFSVDVIGTTLERTIARRYVLGARVNLERALAMGDRIDGHLVQGHVDGVGQLRDSIQEGEFWLMDFSLPPEVYDLTLLHGSITLNGVSLTVSALLPDSGCRIGVIPFTYAHTNFGVLAQGDPVNVEGDLIGKYVGRIMANRPSPQDQT